MDKLGPPARPHRYLYGVGSLSHKFQIQLFFHRNHAVFRYLVPIVYLFLGTVFVPQLRHAQTIPKSYLLHCG